MPVGTTYYDHYINRAKQANASVSHSLAEGLKTAQQLFSAIPTEKWNYQYAPDKWSVKELVQHIIDTERVFSGRALSFARGESQSLPGFDQDAYVQNSFAAYREPLKILAEYNAVRQSTLLLFDGFSDATYQKTGNASGVGFTVEEVGYIMAGHELHHLDILTQRYL